MPSRSVPQFAARGMRNGPNFQASSSPSRRISGAGTMDAAELLTRVAAELALFAGVGFLLFAVNDLAVDLIYFGRRAWRAATVYRRFPRAFASELASPGKPGFIAIFVPAWDEAAVIAPMLRATLEALRACQLPDLRRPLPQRSGDRRGDRQRRRSRASSRCAVDADGPTTKADCLNHLYDALIAYETATRPVGQGGRAPRRRGRRPPARARAVRPADRPRRRDPAAGAAADRPALALDQRPLLRRVRRGARQGAGGARSGRRGDPAGRRRLRDRPRAARPAGRDARRPAVRRRQHDRGL